MTFVNKDEIAHTATADGTFDSKTLEQGASFDFTATKAGKIDYVCIFHPGMTGTINVTLARPSDDQTSILVRTRLITSSVNSDVVACPPRSTVLVPDAVASRTDS